MQRRSGWAPHCAPPPSKRQGGAQKRQGQKKSNIKLPIHRKLYTCYIVWCKNFLGAGLGFAGGGAQRIGLAPPTPAVDCQLCCCLDFLSVSRVVAYLYCKSKSSACRHQQVKELCLPTSKPTSFLVEGFRRAVSLSIRECSLGCSPSAKLASVLGSAAGRQLIELKVSICTASRVCRTVQEVCRQYVGSRPARSWGLDIPK
jgi:hypothetical protein